MASRTKKWAFVTEDGPERVTADAVMRERMNKYGGRPTGKTYYSTQRPPNRKPMEHVRPGFFRFKNAADDEANAAGGGGESLQHRLFKEALARAEFLELRLPERHRLRIIHGEMEKQIPVSETDNKFCDVFIGFECDTGDLALKWQSKFCIEVWHEHAVEPAKIDALRLLRVPTVEVKLPAKLAYEYAEEDTTDEREQRYLQRMSDELKFIDAKLISDPSSLEYLEKQLEQVKRSLQSQTDEVARLTREKKQLRESADTALQNSENQWSTKHGELLKSSSLEAQKSARVYRVLLAVCAALGFLAGVAAAPTLARWFG